MPSTSASRNCRGRARENPLFAIVPESTCSGVDSGKAFRVPVKLCIGQGIYLEFQ